MDAERTYYPDGTLKSEGAIIDGVPHGVIRHWHPNGVLATEMTLNHGVYDGTIRQWNEKGELVATSELKKGTGVLRTLYPEQGLDGEITFVDGKMTGRQLVYSDIELITIVYWLYGKQVSRKRYDAACQKDPTLPRYEDDRALGPTWLQTMNKERRKMKEAGGTEPQRPRAVTDELPLKLLSGPGVREALAWLEESREPSRSLGEDTDQDESIRLVKKLYGLGAVGVHAVEICGQSNQEQNTGRLVVELPNGVVDRKRILRFCGKLGQRCGLDPDLDNGQRYTLVMLD